MTRVASAPYDPLRPGRCRTDDDSRRSERTGNTDRRGGCLPAARVTNRPCVRGVAWQGNERPGPRLPKPARRGATEDDAVLTMLRAMRLLTSTEAASRLRVSYRQLQRYVAAGDLAAAQYVRRGRLRFRRATSRRSPRGPPTHPVAARARPPRLRSSAATRRGRARARCLRLGRGEVAMTREAALKAAPRSSARRTLARDAAEPPVSERARLDTFSRHPHRVRDALERGELTFYGSLRRPISTRPYRCHSGPRMRSTVLRITSSS
jgi:Helix-turn-helix domain